MRTRILACALLLAPLPAACRREPPPPPQQPTHFTIRGRLVASGTWVAHASVMAFKVPPADSGYAIEVGAGGVLLNPSAETDSVGRFEMSVPLTFLPPNRTITLALDRPSLLHYVPLLRPDGATLEIVVPPGRQLVSLGNIIARER